MTGRLVIMVLLGVFCKLQTEYVYAVALPLEKNADPKIDKSLIFNSTMDDSSNDDRPPYVSNGEDKPEVGEERSESSVALTRKKRGQKFGEVPDYTVLHNPPTKPICLNCQYEAKPSLHYVPSYPMQSLNPLRADEVNPSPRYGPGNRNSWLYQTSVRPTCLNCRYEGNPPPQHDVPGYHVQNVHPTRHQEVTPSPRYGPGNCLNCKYDQHHITYPSYEHSKGPKLYKIQPLNHPSLAY